MEESFPGFRADEVTQRIAAYRRHTEKCDQKIDVQVSFRCEQSMR